VHGEKTVVAGTEFGQVERTVTGVAKNVQEGRRESSGGIQIQKDKIQKMT
jgi:hypothetical protein